MHIQGEKIATAKGRVHATIHAARGGNLARVTPGLKARRTTRPTLVHLVPDKEATDMRRKAFRSLILAGALVALSVPVFSVAPSIPGLGSFLTSVSACSNPGCIITGTITGTVGTFYSPITIQTSPSNEVESQLCGQPGTDTCPSPVVIPGMLSFGVSDNRGQSQGFTVFVGGPGTSFASAPGTPSGVAISVDGSAFTVTGDSASLTSCFGLTGCAPIVPLASAVGMNLSNPVAVAQQCTNLSDYGNGMYTVGVDYNITLSGQTAENFGLYSGVYDTAIPVSVGEGPANTGGVC